MEISTEEVRSEKVLQGADKGSCKGTDGFSSFLTIHFHGKRTCGLEIGESCSKPKSEDARQPPCTPEKEEAIKQALRHYGVISGREEIWII